MGLIATDEPRSAAVEHVPRGGSPQEEAFYAELTGGTSHILLEARAGSGKSTSCAEGMHRLGRKLKLTYCAFNKSIATEFQAKAPPNCRAATMHSLGYSAIRDATGVVAINDFKTADLAEKYFPHRWEDRENRHAAGRLVSLCKSNLDDGSDPDDLADLAGAHGVDLGTSPEDVLAVVPELLRESREQTSVVDFDDMIWLPIVRGLRPRTADVLFVDEAQDLNPCQQALAERLCPDGRIVVVGDPRQCQPAGTMVRMTGGELKPIELIEEGDEVVSFDRHSSAMVGRIGRGKKVVATSSRPFTGFLLTIGAGNRTVCTPNHKWVTRFAERSTELLVTYLMRKGDRFRVGWCQLFTKDGSLHLGFRARIEKADCAWILGAHATRTDASIQESVLAARYGLPTITFEPVDGAQHLTKEAIDRIFSELASSVLVTRANCCLQAFGRSLDHPFYTVDLQERERASRPSSSLRLATSSPDLMMVPVYNGMKEPVWTGIDHIENTFVADLPVYSLEIEGNKTYVADGLVTHNSIYAFRGADAESIPNMTARLAATGRGIARLPLTVTWRCPRSHVRLANAIVPDLEAAPDAAEGMLDSVPESEAMGRLLAGQMVLCRTNAPLVSACFGLLRRGIRAVVRGRDIGKGLLTLIVRLKAGSIPDLFGKLDDHRVRETARLQRLRHPGPAVLALTDKVDCLMAMCDGLDSIDALKARVEALFSDASEEKAVVFSSVHKAKGLERDDIVILRPDLLPHRMAKTPGEQVQESNLAYVATTRSRARLTFAGPIPLILKG